MKKRTMLVLVAALFVLTAALLIGLFLSDGEQGGQGGITLPAQGGADIDPTPDIGKDNAGRVAEITVDRTNVQRVVASMSRPAQYSYVARAIYAYEGGTTALETRGWVRADLCLVRQYDGEGDLRAQSVLSKSNVYLWGGEGDAFYQGRPGDLTADQMGRLPTYEDVLSLPEDEILEGAVKDWNGRACIYVRSGALRKYTDWYVSLDNGLLLWAGETEGEKQVYSVTLEAMTVADIPDETFLLPNGAMPE